MLEAKEEETYRSSFSSKSYESPNWAYEQADKAGYVRALRAVIDLLKEEN
jgi:hypothetical protein